MKKLPKKFQKYLLSDLLWEKIAPLLSQLFPKKTLGRPRIDDRRALDSIFFVLRSGIPWNALPPAFAPSSTVHDRFSFYCRHGLFLRLWQNSLLDYDTLKKIDWEFQAMDGCHIMAPIACQNTGPSYKHRGKSGVNRSLLTDANGIPIALFIAPANCNDMKLAKPTFQSFAISRPDPALVLQHICLDKGYDAAEVDQLLLEQHYISHIRRRGIDYSDTSLHTARHNKAHRLVVERSHSWFNRFRRIILRWEKKSEHYLAFMHFACSIIIYKKLGLT